MKRDIADLLEESKTGRQLTGCPFADVDGDLAEYVRGLEQLGNDSINKQKVRTILRTVFGFEPGERRVYHHFNPNVDCGC